MSTRNDQVNLIINVNGSKAQNELNELRKRAAGLTHEIKNNLVKGTKEFTAATSELKEVKNRMQEVKKEIGLSSYSMKELNAEKRKFTAIRDSLGPQTAEWKKYNEELQKVIARQKEVTANTNGVSSVSSKLTTGLTKGIGGLAAGYMAFSALKSGFNNVAALGDQLADLQRVAGLTKNEANDLNQSLLNLDTRTSSKGLREIAIVAGKLGVAKEDIYEFTKSVDMLVVSLGDELGNADQITTELGKILNVFDGQVNGDNIAHLGNAVITLANAGVATGGFITDFTQRVAGISKAAGISLGSVVGMAAGFEELGLRSESSSTSLQKLISNIAGDIPKAAKMANVPFAEFNKLFAEKPQEALIKYAEGLTKTKASFSEVAKSFKDAGEEGARTVQMLQAIGQSGDFLREKIDMGNESIQELSAQNEAFALKNDTLQGSIDRLGKAFDKLYANPSVTGFLKGVVTVLEGAVDGFGYLIDSFKSFDQLMKEKAEKPGKEYDKFVDNIVSGMGKQSVAEQQRLADSYKAISRVWLF